MEPTPDYARALGTAGRFLDLFGDPFSRNARDDFAQEAVIELWQRRRSIRDPERTGRYVRTVVRRIRCRALERHKWRRWSEIDSVGEVVPAPSTRPQVLIDREWFDRDRVFAALEESIDGLGRQNAQILRAFYAGATCVELAERFGVSVDVIKCRLHRGRACIRKSLVDRLRAQVR